MLSFSDVRTTIQDLISDTTTAVQTDTDRYYNQGVKDVRTKLGGIYVLEDRFNFTTVIGTQYYDLPVDFLRSKKVTVEMGDRIYTLGEIKDYDYWNMINDTVGNTGDPPESYFIRYIAGWPEIGFYPIPATASDTDGVVIDYIADPPDLSAADVTVTVAGFTNASPTVIDSEFTAVMAGRWLKPDVATGGDGNWYKIASISAGVSATLEKNYEGLTDTSVTCTVAQVALLPKNAHMLPCYFAAAHYYMSKRMGGEADRYWALYNGGIRDLLISWRKKGASQVGYHGRRLGKYNDPNWPPGIVTSS